MALCTEHKVKSKWPYHLWLCWWQGAVVCLVWPKWVVLLWVGVWAVLSWSVAYVRLLVLDWTLVKHHLERYCWFQPVGQVIHYQLCEKILRPKKTVSSWNNTMDTCTYRRYTIITLFILFASMLPVDKLHCNKNLNTVAGWASAKYIAGD